MALLPGFLTPFRSATLSYAEALSLTNSRGLPARNFPAMHLARIISCENTNEIQGANLFQLQRTHSRFRDLLTSS